MRSPSVLFFVLFLIGGALFGITPVQAQDAEPEASDDAALTTTDPKIPVEELRLRVKPLRRAELEVEAEAWLGLLADRVQTIVDADLAVKQSQRAKNAGDPGRPTVAIDVTGTVAVELEGDAVRSKSELLKDLQGLQESRTALIDRVDVVLDSLEAKGGSVEEARQYIAAIQGTDIDLTDAETIVAAIEGWAFSREGGIRWAINLAQAAVILVLAFTLSSLASRGVRRALSRTAGTSTLAVEFLTKSAGRIVLFTGLVLALMSLEFDIGPVLAMVGAAGFVVAFALQDSLGNFASGILMLLYRPFDVGDVVDVAGVSGTVQSMSLVSTHIHTFDNKAVVIPNNSVWGGVITNATRTAHRRVDLVFGIGYGDSIPEAQRILEEIVREHELILDKPEPVIRVHELADSSVNFVCRPWTKSGDYWTVYWDLTRSVKERFDAEGISIPFPQRDVHVYNESSD